MTGAEAVGVGLGFLAIVAPEFWPKMPRALSYTLAGIGLSWLTYSLILGIESLSHTKLQYGPLGIIMLGAALIAGGLFWHISRLDSGEPAHSGHSQVAEKVQSQAPPAPPPAESGVLLDISFDVLPRVAPPDGTIYIFEIRENQHGIEAGVINYVFDPNVVIDWKKVIPEWPIFGVSKGEITSTTSDPVFYAVIPLTLGFQEMLPDPDHPNQSRSGALVTVQNASFAVGRISPDDPYVIYFLNRTKYLVNIVLPPEGKTQDFSKTGDDFEKKIPLKPGRTTGLHLAPAMETKSPPAPPPQAPSPPNTPEKK